MQIKRYLTLVVVLAGAAIVSLEASAQSIKKCQDADGNWHYGDSAAAACIDAVVDELNETGTKIGEDRPPPSEEELKRKEQIAKAIEEQEQFTAEQRNKDLEVVRIYGSEETIQATRDRKLAALDNNIDVTRQIKAGTQKDIDKLRNMKQSNKVKAQLAERQKAIESYDRVIRHNINERDKLADEYSQILVSFRGAYQRIYGQ